MWDGLIPVAISEAQLQQLQVRVGKDRVLTSEADLVVYSTDVGSPPALLNLLLKRKADAVVRPKTAEDVASVVSYCMKNRIPVTPRASATNPMGGAVPKRAGVVLDLTDLSRNIQVDEAKLTVRVDAGVVIRDLRQALNEVGLELPVYPTSGNASTIGGFVAMDGFGIGSVRGGHIGQNVLEVEGVGLDGQPFCFRDTSEQQLIVGAGGATGVITSVTLKVVESTPDQVLLVGVDKYSQLQALAEEVTERFHPKHVLLRNSDFYALRTLGMGAKKNPLGDQHALTLCFDGDADLAPVLKAVERIGGKVLDEKLATEEWNNRFFPLRAKRAGPSVVAGETLVPLGNTAAYVKRLKNSVGPNQLSFEGQVTNDGRVYWFVFALDDERRSTYPLGWGTSARIVWEAKRLGGTVYHPGVYLQAQAKSYYGKARYKALKELKKAGDPRNLMNSGMATPLPAPLPEFVWKAPVSMPVPAPSLGLQLAMGDPVLMLQDKMVVYRQTKSQAVQAAEVAADMARGKDMRKHSDLIWGADLISAQAIPNEARLPMTQTLRGKLALAKAFVTGKIADPNTLAPALNVADPTAAEVQALCPDIEDILALMDDFRRTVTEEGVELQVKAAEVVEEVVEVAAGGDGGPTMTKEEILAKALETPEGEKAWVLAADCIVCNGCETACPTAAAIVTDIARVDRDLCIADGACFDACPTGAIRPGEEDQGSSAGWPEGSRLAGKFGQ